MVNILIQSGLMLFQWGTKRKRTWYIHKTSLPCVLDRSCK